VDILLYVYSTCDSFHQKCSKVGTASRIGDGNEDLKNVFLNAFLGSLKIYVFRKFQKFHSPNQLKCRMGYFSKVKRVNVEKLMFRPGKKKLRILAGLFM
jgi:hypothetical protein